MAVCALVSATLGALITIAVSRHLRTQGRVSLRAATSARKARVVAVEATPPAKKDLTAVHAAVTDSLDDGDDDTRGQSMHHEASGFVHDIEEATRDRATSFSKCEGSSAHAHAGSI